MSMSKKIFRITYFDPVEEKEVTVEKEFEDSPTLTALDWAKDWAYSAADKGWCNIVEVKGSTHGNV